MPPEVMASKLLIPELTLFTAGAAMPIRRKQFDSGRYCEFSCSSKKSKFMGGAESAGGGNLTPTYRYI
jgi:hypothetical protein